jgi:archaellum biogenesis ATPase FlaH
MITPSLSVSSNGTAKINLPIKTPDGDGGFPWKKMLGITFCAGLIGCVFKCASSWYDSEQKKAVEREKVECEKAKADVRAEEFRRKMEIRNEFEQAKKDKNGSSSESDATIQSESLNDILSKPCPQRPKMMGGLITQGEIAILFSPSGQGKSTLAMQIGIDAAEGSSSKLVTKDDEGHKANKVIVYDAEMDDEDIRIRYSGNVFPTNFQRKARCFYLGTDALITDIESLLKGEDGDVTIIIDNISSIIPSLSETAVKEFYGNLKRLKDSYNTDSRTLTFIVVCHTPKVDLSNLPSQSDVAGSANFANFADCMFALWPTNLGDEYKMLYCVKFRKGVRMGDAIVLKCVQDPYLHFEYVKECPAEELLLKNKPKDDTSQSDADGDKDTKATKQARNTKVTTEEVVEKWVELTTDKTLVGLSDPQMREEVASALGVESERTVDRHLRTKVLSMHGVGKAPKDIATELHLEYATVQRYLKDTIDDAS